METTALVPDKKANMFQAMGITLIKGNNYPTLYTVLFPDGTQSSRGTTPRGSTMNVYLLPSGHRIVLRDPTEQRRFRTLELLDNDDFEYFFDHPHSGLPEAFMVNAPA